METGTEKPKRTGTRADIIVDSGASVSAAPLAVVGRGRPTGAERTYKSACGGSLVESGTSWVDLRCVDGKRLSARFRVMPVTKPLASVSQMVGRGAWVVFRPEEDGGSYLWTAEGSKKRLFCRNGVYVLPVWVEKAGGFHGQPHQV